MKGSEYMSWAKLSSSAQFNLARSGMLPFPLRELSAPLDELEINGGGVYGYEPLTNAIALHYGVGPEKVFTAVGTSMANHLAMATLLEPGDEILLEHPVYEPIQAAAAYLKAKIIRFDRKQEKGFELDLNEIEQKITSHTKLIVITNLHNPSSVFTDRESLLQLQTIARKTGSHILVDEIYLDAVFDQHKISAIRLGPEFIVTSSLTKVYGLSGLRCGWVLAEPELIHKMWRLDDLFAASPVYIAQQLSVIAFAKLEKIKRRTQELLSANRTILNRFFDSRKDLETIRTPYGTTSFPKWKSGNTESVCDLLRHKYDTSIVPGRFFGLNDHFRIGLCCESEEFHEGLRRLGTALDESGRNT
jgi:aspartate/methionine/tyrosine aminotransferase